MIVSITNQILGITFLYVDILLVTIMCLGAGVIASLLLPRFGHEWCALRRIPAMDVIDEAVRICAEKGRPFLFTTGSTGFTGTAGQFTESIVSTSRYLTKRCAELGVRYISLCQNAELQLVLYDFARSGYLFAGRPEMFNPKDIVYIQGGVAQVIMENTDYTRREKPAAFVGLGHFGSGTPVPIFQEAVNVGAFVVGSSYWPDELAQAALASDYTLMTAEQSVVGSYIDNDPEKMAVFVGEDVAKLILTFISLGLGILWMMGVKLFV